MAWSNSAIEQGADYLDDYAEKNPEAVGASFDRAAGSDPNQEHLEGGGYHVYFDSLPNGGRYDYSGGQPTARNSNPRDAKQGNPQHESAAWDLGYDEDDMVAISERIQAAIDRDDPRLAPFREFNLWFGGDTRPVNRDHELDWAENYPPNSSHKSHIHAAAYRDVANDWATWLGLIEIITATGEDVLDTMDEKTLREIIRDEVGATLVPQVASKANPNPPGQLLRMVLREIQFGLRGLNQDIDDVNAELDIPQFGGAPQQPLRVVLREVQANLRTLMDKITKG